MSSFKGEIKNLEKRVGKLEKVAEPRKIPWDPVQFFKRILHIAPYLYQAQFLLDKRPLKVLRWCRRAGKTTAMSGDDIHFAATNPNSVILVIMPKHQQVKEIYFQGEGGLHDHLARMDREVFEYLIKEQLQTIIRFRNGSRILAEVPEPFTIRGHGPRKISIDEMNFIRKGKRTNQPKVTESKTRASICGRNFFRFFQIEGLNFYLP